jgi:hypothetical protein
MNMKRKEIEPTEDNISDLLDLANEELDKSSKVICEVRIIFI